MVNVAERDRTGEGPTLHFALGATIPAMIRAGVGQDGVARSVIMPNKRD